jgi:beta-glucosidase
VTEAKVQSVMCAYNAVNGIPACASSDLMEQRLRRAWGFKGFVVSDCGGAANIYRADSLHYTRTPEEAVAAGFKAGMDLICGDYRNGMTTEVQPIINAVRQGLLPEAVVDRSLVRLFAGRIRLGLFDAKPPQAVAAIKPADYDTPAHRAVALKMAQESMVLLKNDGLLPLKAAPRTTSPSWMPGTSPTPRRSPPPRCRWRPARPIRSASRPSRKARAVSRSWSGARPWTAGRRR